MVSTRRSQTGKPSYKAGAKVEVLRADGMIIGTLLFKKARLAQPSLAANDRTSSNAARRNRSRASVTSSAASDHWMVSLESATGIESSLQEDVSERMLGRIVQEPTHDAIDFVSLSEYTTISKSKTQSIDTAPTQVSLPLAPAPKKDKDGSKTAVKAGKTCKAAQSKTSAASSSSSKSKATMSNQHASRSNKSKAQISPAASSNAAVLLTKTLRPNEVLTTRRGEPVIKVAMLTGTLYLYQGAVRRAEFVRTR